MGNKSLSSNEQSAIQGDIFTEGRKKILFHFKSYKEYSNSIPTINTIVKELCNKGFSLLSTSLEGDKDFFEEDLSGNLIISVGNEGNGVSKEIYDLSDKKVKIPMPGGAESLNVAIAASIILYEKVRQNKLNF